MGLQNQTEQKFRYITYVTFGQRFRYEEHLHIPEAHPDGWVEFHFNSSLECTTLKGRFLGSFYSHIYTEQEFDLNSAQTEFQFPKGCLRIMTVKDLLTPISLTDHLN